MSLSIEEVFARAKEDTISANISYVFDAPIHYIVLKRSDNTISMPWMEEFHAVLDRIEASKGPGVVVTIGTGKKNFSTGFDMMPWYKDPALFYPSNVKLQALARRLMMFSLPTMCVFNGNSIAGGYLLGLGFDFRIMNGA